MALMYSEVTEGSWVGVGGVVFFAGRRVVCFTFFVGTVFDMMGFQQSIFGGQLLKCRFSILNVLL